MHSLYFFHILIGISIDTMDTLRLRIFYLKKRVMFPYCTLAVYMKITDDSKDIKKGDQILAFSIRSLFDLVVNRNRLATLSEVIDAMIEDQTLKILIKGLARVRIKKIIKYRHADFELLNPHGDEIIDFLNDELRKKSQELIFLINVEESDKLINLLNYIIDLNQMTDFITNYFIINFRTRYRIYTEIDVKKRALLLISELTALIDSMTKKRKKQGL